MSSIDAIDKINRYKYFNIYIDCIFAQNLCKFSNLSHKIARLPFLVGGVCNERRKIFLISNK